MDRIDALRAFVEVAERRSFTEAAARLGLSKALVSKRVMAVEAEAGAKLLARTTRSVRPTEAGTAFLERARGVLAGWEGMMEGAAEDPDRPTGLLRVAGPKVFGETVLAPLVAEFLAAQPGLRAELAFEERRVDVVGEGFDLAVRLGELEDSGLVAVRLTRFPYLVCASPDYLARRGTPDVPRDLEGHDCVVNAALAPTGQWLFDEGGRMRRVTVPARVRVNSDGPAAACVRAGLGVGLLMRRPLEAEIADGRIVPLLTEFHAYDREVHALLPHRPPFPAKTRLLLDHLKARLGR